MNDPKYRLQAFGGLSAHLVEPARAVLVGQRKRLALLAALAADGNGGVSRDRLLAMFWPEADAAHARNALKQLVHSIRRELSDDAIVDVNGQLTLARDVMSSDVRDFRAAVQEGSLTHAAELYRGPFLDGVYLRDAPEFERMLEETRRSLEMQYASSLEQLATTAMRDGDHASSIRWARALAALDPLSTRSALLVISALEASGDAAAAIKHGELHASLLQHE
ncbi:MAG TPA: BTAD domain-containing putative transcriptional regulator, partial [Gemmatimonadaceae bacterium]|nr:BTAD domain-containing putative transcriptional regulator [Gemmatimonadaceae bacterium]